MNFPVQDEMTKHGFADTRAAITTTSGKTLRLHTWYVE